MDRASLSCRALGSCNWFPMPSSLSTKYSGKYFGYKGTLSTKQLILNSRHKSIRKLHQTISVRWVVHFVNFGDSDPRLQALSSGDCLLQLAFFHNDVYRTCFRILSGDKTLTQRGGVSLLSREQLSNMHGILQRPFIHSFSQLASLLNKDNSAYRK